VGLVGTQIFRWITTRESKGGGVGGGVITTQIFRLNTTRESKGGGGREGDDHANFSSEHNKGE
jgi:hypothetical protein